MTLENSMSKLNRYLMTISLIVLFGGCCYGENYNLEINLAEAKRTFKRNLLRPNDGKNHLAICWRSRKYDDVIEIQSIITSLLIQYGSGKQGRPSFTEGRDGSCEFSHGLITVENLKEAEKFKSLISEKLTIVKSKRADQDGSNFEFHILESRELFSK